VIDKKLRPENRNPLLTNFSSSTYLGAIDLLILLTNQSIGIPENLSPTIRDGDLKIALRSDMHMCQECVLGDLLHNGHES
jgi:hypothetical protein